LLCVLRAPAGRLSTDHDQSGADHEPAKAPSQTFTGKKLLALKNASFE